MALSKERKQELLEQYATWLKDGTGIFLTEYTGMTMKDFDVLRKDIRDMGGEFHVVKNTLIKRAFEAAEMEIPAEILLGSTAIGVAFEDAPGVAKAIKEFGKENEAVKIKGGYMDGRYMAADEVLVLADLPPLPVMRAKLLGVINAPATKLVRTLNEPGTSLARVFKAYADKGGETAAAA